MGMDVSDAEFRHCDFAALFKSIELLIRLVNQGSKTRVQSPDVSLVEVVAKGMVLDVPKNCCSQGHYLEVQLQAQQGDVSVIFISTVKVDKYKDLFNGRRTISVSMVQYDEGSWKKFQKVFDRRQESINEFFDAVKD